VFVEKTIYAEAELTRDHQLTSLAKLFPLYARVPVDELLRDARPPRVELDGVEIDYPLHAPRIDPGGARPNILILVIDCLRSDMLAPETMPAISDWADDARIFENHVSGGNSTRYGIFSMIYGLHGSYWFPFLQERRSPVLIDTLLDLGYEIGIFSSASMNYPELRDTAWVRVQDRVFDQHRSPYPWRKDELAAEEMTRWLEARENDSRPFFGFILLDAPHQTYSHPPDATWFRPSAVELDYMSMTQNEGPAPQVLEAVRNRYKNAVRHADGVASDILDRLARSSFADDTVVLVTGDHGEEFRECGFFGHTSAFTPWQVGVPLLVKGPGVQPGREDGPTSHHDIAPTLLEMLGAHPEDRGLWTLGENLFAPAAGRDRVISGWNELGVWTSHGILRVPMSAFDVDVELYDYDWRLQSDDDEITRAEQGTLERLGAECNRFLR
jgi:membrane-anchored protein YejM (alkaline phosphatase superfamily)